MPSMAVFGPELPRSTPKGSPYLPVRATGSGALVSLKPGDFSTFLRNSSSRWRVLSTLKVPSPGTLKVTWPMRSAISATRFSYMPRSILRAMASPTPALFMALRTASLVGSFHSGMNSSAASGSLASIIASSSRRISLGLRFRFSAALASDSLTTAAVAGSAGSPGSLCVATTSEGCATSGTSGCTFPICPATSASRSSTACRPASVAERPSARSTPARASTAALSSAARAAPTFFKQVVKLMRTPRSGPGQSTPLRSLLPLGRAHAGADAVRIAPRLRLRWCGQRQSTARPQGPAWRLTGAICPASALEVQCGADQARSTVTVSPASLTFCVMAPAVRWVGVTTSGVPDCKPWMRCSSSSWVAWSVVRAAAVPVSVREA